MAPCVFYFVSLNGLIDKICVEEEALAGLKGALER